LTVDTSPGHQAPAPVNPCHLLVLPVKTSSYIVPVSAAHCQCPCTSNIKHARRRQNTCPIQCVSHAAVKRCSALVSRVRPMYTLDIENRRHRSLLEHRCQQVADVDVVKIEFAGGGVCDGCKTTAVNSNVKTRDVKIEFFG